MEHIEIVYLIATVTAGSRVGLTLDPARLTGGRLHEPSDALLSWGGMHSSL